MDVEKQKWKVYKSKAQNKKQKDKTYSCFTNQEQAFKFDTKPFSETSSFYLIFSCVLINISSHIQTYSFCNKWFITLTEK